jgi:hypothetical protein
MKSFDSTARSASFPTSSEPRTSSSNENQALPDVYSLSASRRLGISAGPRIDAPETVRPSSSHCNAVKGL